ncbi:MAG: hypothetical protein JRN11_06520 [Nitrososphaerota archaeon]|nr:hypothetical protein [Nitrososphaerota archaeon]MDG7026384.1 hypothetical protein [Nitrososphaerota archaeon]
MSKADFVIVSVPKKADLVFQVQNIPDTEVWAVVSKGELAEVVRKARLFDLIQAASGQHAPKARSFAIKEGASWHA